MDAIWCIFDTLWYNFGALGNLLANEGNFGAAGGPLTHGESRGEVSRSLVPRRGSPISKFHASYSSCGKRFFAFTQILERKPWQSLDIFP
jgi:hypothetical protein